MWSGGFRSPEFGLITSNRHYRVWWLMTPLLCLMASGCHYGTWLAMDTTMGSGSIWPPPWGLVWFGAYYGAGGFGQPLWGLVASIHYYGV